MRRLAIFASALALGGCTLAELDTLVPAIVIPEATDGLPYKSCKSSTPALAVRLVEHQPALVRQLRVRIAAVRSNLPPALAQDRVVRSILQQTDYVVTNSTVQAQALLGEKTDL